MAAQAVRSLLVTFQIIQSWNFHSVSPGRAAVSWILKGFCGPGVKTKQNVTVSGIVNLEMGLKKVLFLFHFSFSFFDSVLVFLFFVLQNKTVKMSTLQWPEGKRMPLWAASSDTLPIKQGMLAKTSLQSRRSWRAYGYALVALSLVLSTSQNCCGVSRWTIQ